MALTGSFVCLLGHGRESTHLESNGSLKCLRTELKIRIRAGLRVGLRLRVRLRLRFNVGFRLFL